MAREHDDAGDVIVGVRRRHPVVYSLATVNDRPRARWKYRGRRRDRPQALGVLPDGDVLTAGQTVSARNDGLFAARIAGDTGRARWRWSDCAGDPRGGALIAATVSGPTGDVFLAPQFVDEDPTRESEFTVVALAGATGSERWRSILADVARVDRSGSMPPAT